MARYKDDFIYSPDEVNFRQAVQGMFKNGYSRDELLVLFDRSIFKLLCEEWDMSSTESAAMLAMSLPKFTLIRDQLG